MKTFKKNMKPNGSLLKNTNDHYAPLKVLQSLNHPLIPKLISYDNESYECEFIEGENLFDYIQRTQDVEWGITLVKTINEFLYSLLKLSHKSEPRLFADDISGVNIIVTTEGKPYIIDLDQFGFFETQAILNIFKETNIRLYDAVLLSLLNGTVNKQNIRIKALENKLLTLM